LSQNVQPTWNEFESTHSPLPGDVWWQLSTLWIWKAYGWRLGIIVFELFHLRRGLACGVSHAIRYHPRPIACPR
jgi:hypothetical protein